MKNYNELKIKRLMLLKFHLIWDLVLWKMIYMNSHTWSFILQLWKSILNELKFLEMDLDDDLGEDGLSRDGIEVYGDSVMMNPEE